MSNRMTRDFSESASSPIALTNDELLLVSGGARSPFASIASAGPTFIVNVVANTATPLTGPLAPAVIGDGPVAIGEVPGHSGS